MIEALVLSFSFIIVFILFLFSPWGFGLLEIIEDIGEYFKTKKLIQKKGKPWN